MKKEIENEFFDLVQENGLRIEEVIELTKMYIRDYRDGFLEDPKNYNTNQAIKLLSTAQDLIREIDE